MNSQTIDVMLFPYEENGKWGFKNANDSIIIKPKFEEAYPTFNSRGRIKYNGKYGFIDEKGEIIIKPKFDSAEDYKFGLVSVSLKGKTKTLDKEGKVSKRSYALCGGVFQNCLSPKDFIGIDTIRINGKYHGKYHVQIHEMVRENGKLNYYPDTLSNTFDMVESLANQYVILTQGERKALFFDEYGFVSAEYVDTLLEFKYQEFKFFSCQNSKELHHEIFGFKRNDKWGYIRLFYEPNEIIEPKYIWIGSMERGVALVEYEEGKFGYINEKGKEYFSRDK